MDFLSLAVGIALLSLVLAVYFFVSGQKSSTIALMLKQERDSLLVQKDDAVAARNEAQKKLAQMEIQLESMKERMKDWEANREHSIQAAKAAVLEAGNIMSNKLLEDHKREQAALKTEQEQHTTKLNEQLQNVLQNVATIRELTAADRERVATLWKTIASPGGAGQLSEIGLENALKTWGLEAQRDFAMQYHLSGQGLRPDCVVFLPNNQVMVIDSKASKFVLDIATAATEEEKLTAQQKLKSTMQEHLRALVSKNYKSAVQSAYVECGRSGECNVVISAMYVPSESIIEHLSAIDPEFPRRAEEAGIGLVGPRSLFSALAVARHAIDLSRQAENQERIVSVTGNLLSAMSTMLAHADKVGTGLRQASDNFIKFAGSVNRNLLPKAQQLSDLGVKPSKGDMPARLKAYELHMVQDETVAVDDTVTVLPVKQAI